MVLIRFGEEILLKCLINNCDVHQIRRWARLWNVIQFQMLNDTTFRKFAFMLAFGQWWIFEIGTHLIWLSEHTLYPILNRTQHTAYSTAFTLNQRLWIIIIHACCDVMLLENRNDSNAQNAMSAIYKCTHYHQLYSINGNQYCIINECCVSSYLLGTMFNV